MNDVQAKVIEIIAQSPLTLSDPIAAIGRSWVDVCQALDPLVATGVIAISTPAPVSLSMPVYYLNA